MQLKFILPLPPSVNHQYSLRGGLMTLSDDAQVYRRTLLKALQRLKAAGKLNLTSLSMVGECEPDGNANIAKAAYRGKGAHKRLISMRYEFFLRSLYERDLDNGVKLVQDAICEALGFDDRDVVEIHMAKRVDRENPRLVVLMKLLDYWDSEGESSLFRQLEDADSEFNLLTVVKRDPQKHSQAKPTTLSSLEELIERFKWE